ncbi:MAG TPA: PilX N-terminal domain-containing pilus assembly protein [Gammaproteobacteria bacterium]|jgi:type IV pilus assembly protein PilX
MNAPVSFQRGGRQRGVVLVVSLLMLMVLTMIGLAATRGTALEQRMTANQSDREVAFEAAEAALRFGEGTLSAASQPDYAGNTAGAYNNTGYTSWATPSFWTTAANVATYTGGIQPTPSAPPTYYVVQSTTGTTTNNTNHGFGKGTSSETVFYVYARGVGTSGTATNPGTTVILQSAITE